MRRLSPLLLTLALACGAPAGLRERLPELPAGSRPESFPSRIIAAADFELLRGDQAWFGRIDTARLPAYPGNAHALRAIRLGPGLIGLGIAPPERPRLGAGNRLYFRYFLRGADRLELQLTGLERDRLYRARVTGLEPGRWAEATVALDSLAAEDGGRGAPPAGERLGNLLLLATVPAGGSDSVELVVDDLILFSTDQWLPSPPADEKFPRRVIALWGFDRPDYFHPWTHQDYRVELGPGAGGVNWGTARALGDSGQRRVRLPIDPPQAVGERTRLSFLYRLERADSIQVMIFDLTDMDNRHIIVRGGPDWRRARLDFTIEGIRNDRNQTPFEAGSRVDDLFFLAMFGRQPEPPELILDEVVLYDAGD